MSHNWLALYDPHGHVCHPYVCVYIHVYIYIYIYIYTHTNTCLYVYKDVHTDLSHGTRASLTALDQKGKDRPRCPKWHYDISRKPSRSTYLNALELEQKKQTCLKNSKTSHFLYTCHISFNETGRSCAAAEESDSTLKPQNRAAATTQELPSKALLGPLVLSPSSEVTLALECLWEGPPKLRQGHT